MYSGYVDLWFNSDCVTKLVQSCNCPLPSLATLLPYLASFLKLVKEEWKTEDKMEEEGYKGSEKDLRIEDRNIYATGVVRERVRIMYILMVIIKSPPHTLYKIDPSILNGFFYQSEYICISVRWEACIDSRNVGPIRPQLEQPLKSLDLLK